MFREKLYIEQIWLIGANIKEYAIIHGNLAMKI